VVMMMEVLIDEAVEAPNPFWAGSEKERSTMVQLAEKYEVQLYLLY
jgi:hypothetical protein